MMMLAVMKTVFMTIVMIDRVEIRRPTTVALPTPQIERPELTLMDDQTADLGRPRRLGRASAPSRFRARSMPSASIAFSRR